MGQFKQLRNNNNVETVTKERISITETIHAIHVLEMGDQKGT